MFCLVSLALSNKPWHLQNHRTVEIGKDFWRSSHPNPLPVLDHSHSKKVFLDVQIKLLVFQFVPDVSYLVREQHWEREALLSVSLFLARSIHVCTHINNTHNLFPKLDNPTLSAFPSWRGNLLVALRWTLPSMAWLSYTGEPSTGNSIQVWPNICWVEWREQLLQTAASTLQNGYCKVSLLCSQGILLADM